MSLGGRVSVKAWIGVLTSKEMSGVKQSLNVGAGQFRNLVFEGKGETRALGCLAIILYDGIHDAAGAYLDMPQEAVFCVGAAVEHEDDLVVFELEVGDDHAIARLGAQALGRHHVQVGFAGGLKFAVRHECKSLMSLGERAHCKALLRLHDADQFEPGLGIKYALGERHFCGLNL